MATSKYLPSQATLTVCSSARIESQQAEFVVVFCQNAPGGNERGCRGDYVYDLVAGSPSSDMFAVRIPIVLPEQGVDPCVVGDHGEVNVVGRPGELHVVEQGRCSHDHEALALIEEAVQ